MNTQNIRRVSLGLALLFAASVAGQAQNNVTYRVDMTEQIQLGNFQPGDTIRVTGALPLWNWGDGTDLTNNPALSGDASNIYSAVIDVPGSPGAAGGEFKFRANGNWEDTTDGANRNFILTGGDQVLPVLYYNDQPLGATTNANVTFQVDMTPQVIAGSFTNGVSTVTLAGNINNWGQTDMANNPALSGNASNIYSTTVSTTTSVGMWSRYKFRADGGWEAAALNGVNQNKDRRFYFTGGDQVLPLVTYNDASLCDVLLKETPVTIVLHLPNGTLDRNGVPFNKAGGERVFINGDFLKWPAWSIDNMPEMTNNPPGSDYYEQTFVLPAGSPRRLQFKCGIDGGDHGALDNENVTYSDHVKYVRDDSNPYKLPAAEFGPNFNSTLVEPVFGNLTAGVASSGFVPITWLGCPCATLQVRTNIVAGSWIDLPATDSLSATNWPNTDGMQFFRLQKRAAP
jgi:hypothetical protein